MKITSSELVISAVRISQYPTAQLTELLILGRSNVGKSSFINTIANNNKLARVSNKPGKTETLNFYLFNQQFYIVDVPGYGYADASQGEQRKFGLMIEEYLEHRCELKRVLMLVDARMKPTEDDVLMYKFLKYYNIPVTIIATKIDKISNNKRDKSKKLILSTLGLNVGDDLVLFSSVTKEGRDTVLNMIKTLITTKTETEDIL